MVGGSFAAPISADRRLGKRKSARSGLARSDGRGRDRCGGRCRRRGLQSQPVLTDEILDALPRPSGSVVLFGSLCEGDRTGCSEHGSG